MKHIIVGTTGHLDTFTFGTATGKLFDNPKSAERKIKKLEDKYPQLSFITVEVRGE